MNGPSSVLLFVLRLAQRTFEYGALGAHAPGSEGAGEDPVETPAVGTGAAARTYADEFGPVGVRRDGVRMPGAVPWRPGLGPSEVHEH